jgi:uncharacterized membrane protein (UPF0127 family)
MRQVLIHNQTHPLPAPIRAGYASSFLSRFRGLMLRAHLDPREGLLLVEARESRVNSAIHMLFMRFDLAVIWLDDHFRVVDAQLAKRWRPSYVPAGPARYTLETRPEYLSEFQPGDQVLIAE